MVACLQESFAEDWFWAARELPPLILPDTYADVEALQRDTGYSPSTPIETGVKRFVDWYQGYYQG